MFFTLNNSLAFPRTTQRSFSFPFKAIISALDFLQRFKYAHLVWYTLILMESSLKPWGGIFVVYAKRMALMQNRNIQTSPHSLPDIESIVFFLVYTSFLWSFGEFFHYIFWLNNVTQRNFTILKCKMSRGSTFRGIKVSLLAVALSAV